MELPPFLPPPGFSRETTIHRDARGQWTQDGVPLEHTNLVRAFDRWIERAADGRLCLKNDLGWAYVTIEGAPLFVRSVRLDAEGALLVLSDDREERLDAHTLRIGPDGALYCDARGGTLTARFDRHAQTQLAPALHDDEAGVHITLGTVTMTPPTVADPLVPVG